MPDNVLSRNAAVYHQLANDYLRAVDVAGDGNCYFRALSFCIHGNQRSHASLRALIASHVKRQAETAATEDKATLLKRAGDIATDRFWPGEDIVLATAFCLQRAIVVYVTHGSSSPFTYSPLTASSKPPLTLAFFEPGHYMAVVPIASTHIKVSNAVENALSPMSCESTCTSAVPGKHKQATAMVNHPSGNLLTSASKPLS